MRLLWHSQAPWVAGGYGNQTGLFVPRIAALGHDVVVSANFGLRGAALNWGTTPVWPAGAEQWGNDSLSVYLQAHVREDGLAITLMDVHALKCETLRKYRTAAWVPIDHEPVSVEQVVLPLHRYELRPIVMSRFGRSALVEAGFDDALYVPHGVDTNLFQPSDRIEARRLLSLPEDAFVVGMVAANFGSSPPRKAFPEALLAFAEFRRKHPDAVLYLHTDLLGGAERTGVDLIQYMRQIGMPEKSVYAVDHAANTVRVPPEHLVATYSALDVLLNPAYGEGFGIPIMEAQACGTPVIVNDCTSMPELCGAGWITGGDDIWIGPYGAWWKRPDVDSIIDRLERAYTNCSPKLRQKARRFALDYDADRVMAEYWKPALDALATG